MALFGNKKIDEGIKKAVPAKSAKKEAVKKEVATSMQDLYSGTSSATKTATGKVAAKVTTSDVKSTVSPRILVKPLITEKATNLVAVNKYSFIVDKNANKISVAKAISTIYGVKPLLVNIINHQGKKVARGKVRGQRSDSKKAIVTLKKGETIKIYEGV